MAVRWAMLVAAALAILVASGAMATPMQGSSLRLAVTAVFALLAPLFWPGRCATSARTVLSVVAWSIAVTVSAAIAILVVARPAQPWLPVVEVCAMLLMLLLLSHAAAAALERRWHARSVDAAHARELAGRAVAVVLGLWGTLPFWAGPMAELLTPSHPGTIDVVLGASEVSGVIEGAAEVEVRRVVVAEAREDGLEFPDAVAVHRLEPGVRRKPRVHQRGVAVGRVEGDFPFLEALAEEDLAVGPAGSLGVEKVTRPRVDRETGEQVLVRPGALEKRERLVERRAHRPARGTRRRR